MNWWQRVWKRKELDEQLDKELRFHLEQQSAEIQAQGYGAGEARRLARIALGGPEQVKESCRDARGTRWLEDFLQDFRYALRTLWQRPGFAAVVLLTLALGSGATTVMFTVVNGVLLKPLPYAQPSRLVTLQEKTEKPTQFGYLWAFAYPNYLDCRRQIRTHTSMAAWRYGGGTISGASGAEYADGLQISSEIFSVLGISPLQGRAFLPEEDKLGGSPVMMISRGLWQRLFGANPSAIGAVLRFEGKPYTVVGIVPENFQLGESADVFTPLGQDNSPSLQNRDRHPGINVIARLGSGITIEQTRTELAVIGQQLAKQYPESNAGRSFVAEPLRPDVGDAGATLWLLLGAVSFVLLIACANVANLLLARAAAREREFAMRAALGASWSRLVRQCLTESAVLGLCGGALGVLLAMAGVTEFVKFWPGDLPRAAEVRLDWRVMLFVVGISLLSGLIFGLAPALRMRSRDLERAVHAGARTVGPRLRRLQGSFVIGEIAIAVILLVSAGILGRTLLRLSTLSPGVNVQNVLVARVALSPSMMANPAGIRAAWQEILESALQVPGVQSVATVDTVPMREGNNQVGYWTSADLPAPSEQPLALATSVTPDYLQVMGIPLLQGRFFSEQDRLGREIVVVIDDVLAQKAFGGEDPVGRRLWLPDLGSPFSSGTQASDAVRVVGVVGHVRYWGLAGDDQAQVRAQFYYPFAQVPDSFLARWSELTSIAVRTNSAPLSVLAPLRDAVRGVTGDQVLYDVRTLDQLAAASLARQRFMMMVLGMFSVLAMVLACIGIYGVLAYLTGQRVPEIGLRMALGASARDVLGMVMRQSGVMIFIGVGVGVVGGVVAARLLESYVPGVRSIEPATFALMVAVLIGAALVASFVPARRASRVDPMSALRQE
jgi:putative ABC transport system permease protein